MIKVEYFSGHSGPQAVRPSTSNTAFSAYLMLGKEIQKLGVGGNSADAKQVV